MSKKILLALLLGVAVVPLSPGAFASHTEPYAKVPTERDDQGRSVEPDFARTSVLGPLVENRVIDTDLDGVATADSGLLATPAGQANVLAPGCTDDSGRRPSGLCGLWTIGFTTHVGAAVKVIPSNTVGVQGMSGDRAPGRFTPTKGTPVRFLDALHHHQNFLPATGSGYIEVNRKIDDTGVRGVLAAVDPNLASPFLMPTSSIWAWYGKWADKNGNGVIDSFYDQACCPASPPPAPPTEEFVWYGNCLRFPNVPYPPSVTAGFCAYDTEKAAGGTTRIQGFLYPGNHHSFCGGTFDPLFLTCVVIPADIPGRQAIHILGATGVPICAGVQADENAAGMPVGIFCGLNIQTFDNVDAQVFGDPLVGEQDLVTPDQEFNDRGGDPRLGVRQWVYGLGWVTYFYDQSILSSMVQVTTVGCPANPASPNTVDLGACRFADVDKFNAFSPATESLLQGTVKPALRSNWVFVRGEWSALVNGIDAVRNNRARDINSVYGPLEDQTQNAGFGREPNDAGDSYPAATRGTCANPDATHNGWCNDYSAHQAGARAYGDILLTRAVIVNRPAGAGASCTLCVSGVFYSTPFSGEAPSGSPLPVLRAAGDHRRTLGPGQYIFGGIFGTWQDRPQTWTEAFYDPTCLVEPSNAKGTCGGTTGLTRSNTYTRSADGWVGNIVNQTSTFYYRGYTDEACTTDQGSGVRTYAACHPYRDGAINNPQGYGAGRPDHREFVGRCDGATPYTLTPADGTWTVPVFVWRGHFGGIDATKPDLTLAQIQDFTGKSEPINLVTQCATGAAAGGLGIVDLVILPLGNQGETIVASATAKVGLEFVKDVDTYHAWG